MKKSEIVIPIRATKDRWPRDSVGDPAFASYDELHQLFSDDQIIAMANRYLRQQEYQTQASRKYELAKAETKRLTRLRQQ